MPSTDASIAHAGPALAAAVAPHSSTPAAQCRSTVPLRADIVRASFSATNIFASLPAGGLVSRRHTASNSRR